MTLDRVLEIARAAQREGAPQYIAEHGGEDFAAVMDWLVNTLGPALPCGFETPTNTRSRGIDCPQISAATEEEALGIVAEVIRATEREPDVKPIRHWTR